MKSLKLILGLALGTTGLGSTIAFGVANNVSSEKNAKPALAGSSNYKIVGYVSSLGLTGFNYASGSPLENGGSDNVAFVKGVKLTSGDVFKLTDNSAWLGYNNRDGYGIESNQEYFYYAAQNNKLWTGKNLFWKSDNKTCTGDWGTTGADSYVDGGEGQITVQMKTPMYDYGGTYWTTDNATTWIECYPGSVNWSSAAAKKTTSGNVQTWEFSFSLAQYSSFKFMRCGTSYTDISYWGAETDTFSCESVFSGDKNMYVRQTGIYNIYINNSNNIYMEDAIQRWIDDYMHMTDYTENKGWCNDSTHNYYGNAKDALLDLGDDAVNYFESGADTKYAAALERYNAWANASKDNKPFGANYRATPIISKTDTGLIVAATASIALTGTAAVVLYTHKKRKQQ